MCYATSTFIIEVLCLSTSIQLFEMSLKIKVNGYIQHQLTLIRLFSASHLNFEDKVTVDIKVTIAAI